MRLGNCSAAEKMFGSQPSSSFFGTPSSSTPPAFGSTPTSSMFGTPSSAFPTSSANPPFGTTPSTPGFGTASTFATGFATTLFNTPFSQQSQPQQQQQQPSPFFQTPQSSSPFGTSTPFGATPAQQSSSPFGQQFGTQAPAMSVGNFQLTTQMAPVAPLPFSLADRDIQAIVDAYKEDQANPKYAFKHLLFSVTEPQYRVKPPGASDIMWAEAMGKLEGMESSNRERLWPQLVQGFKDLSNRLKLEDEVIHNDSERLRLTQKNVKLIQCHVQADTLPRIQRMKQKEQALQRRLLKVMKIVEALEGKGCRLPLTKGEAELAEKLAAITRQLKGSGAELSRRVQNLLTLSRVQANGLGGGSVCLPGSIKIHEQSLTAMHEVLQQQTEAIGRLGSVFKRDVRDMEIIMAEEATDMSDD